MATDLRPYTNYDRETIVADDGEGTLLIFTNHLFSVPLFSWWCIEMYVNPALIGSTLLDDITQRMYGPYEDKDQAMDAIMSNDDVDFRIHDVV